MPLDQQSNLGSSVHKAPIADWNTYDRDGVLFLPRFFSDREAVELEDGWQNLVQVAEGANLKRSDRFVFGVLPGPIGKLYQHPALIALAHAQCGPDLALYMNRILLKDRGWNGPVSMHQDMPYFNGGFRKLSIFVPLKPVQADGGNGGLKFVLGSHRYGNLQRGTIDRQQFEPMADFAPSMAVGDILLMDFFTWHWSEAAEIATDRPLMQIVYQPADDGSYAGPAFGVAAPTLIAGRWQTNHFAELHVGITPDVR
jgi:hypothetical protein